jgi:hypothetical protein
MTDDASALKQMIESLDDTIATARGGSQAFVAHLLEMARLELLMQYHGIEERELERFCEALTEERTLRRNRRPVILGAASPRRARRGRSKARNAKVTS